MILGRGIYKRIPSNSFSDSKKPGHKKWSGFLVKQKIQKMQWILAVFIIRFIMAATEKDKKGVIKNTETNSTIVHPEAYQLR